MAIKVELVPANKAGEVLEKALKVRDPELWQRRKEGRAQAKKKGQEVTPPGWRLAEWSADRNFQERLRESARLYDLNRDFAKARAEQYANEMAKGRWIFTPDPIVITEEGLIINGQHRLGAAMGVVWEEGDEIPLFLVVWGVDTQTALLMDEANRSTQDRRKIGLAHARLAS